METLPSFLIPISHHTDCSSVPYILIDTSGSTADEFSNAMNVYNYECQLVRQLFYNNPNSYANVIFWNTDAVRHDHLNLEQFNTITGRISSNGGTHLKCAFEQISDINHTEITIVTDGEISDSEKTIAKYLRRYADKSCRLSIIAVEPNNNDYSKNEVSVGNRLYAIIRDCHLTRMVERFSVYNQLLIEYVNLSNPVVDEGYIPYGNYMFKVNDFNLFLGYLKSLSSDQFISQLPALSLTIYKYTQNKSYNDQVMIVDLCCNIAKNMEVRSALLSELHNHITGQQSTFTEMRREKHREAENNIIDLIKNTANSLTIARSPVCYGFPINNGHMKYYLVESYQPKYNDVIIDCYQYVESGLSIPNLGILPIMFDFDQNRSKLASQWIKLIYGNRLHISPNGEHLYYYILCDAYLTDNLLLKRYVDAIFENSDKKMDQVTCINIPYNVLCTAIKYCGLEGIISPKTLYYVIMMTMLITRVKDCYKISIIGNFRQYCKDDIIHDLSLDPTSSWEQIEDILINKKYVHVDVQKILCVGQCVLKNHQYSQIISDIECPCRTGHYNQHHQMICDLCQSTVDLMDMVDQTSQISHDVKRYGQIYDTSKCVNLGMLSGIPKYDLLCPTEFGTDNTSFTVDNMMLVDTLMTSKLQITNVSDFNQYVKSKYPFISQLHMNNVALCGGFVRSVLLKQRMKDFDFFFYGLDTDEQYIDRVKSLISDIVPLLKQENANYRMAFFYKPQFNVIEMVCYNDPNHHIGDDFSLENFDIYKYHSLRKYTRKHRKEKEQTERKSRKKGVNDKYYFEDGDEHGVTMVYRIQMVMCKYHTVLDIFKSFDMFPSMVGFDGHQVFFTPQSLLSYQYMINEINIQGGTDLAKHRISKYFKYGFKIILPPNTRQWTNHDCGNDYDQDYVNYKGTDENKGPLKFKVPYINHNIYYVRHNSHIENLLNSAIKLEKEANNDGVCLYKTSLFCSFVSMLRYVKINNINYAFPKVQDETNLFDNDVFKLQIPTKLHFIDHQTTIYPTTEWYDKFIKSLIFDTSN